MMACSRKNVPKSWLVAQLSFSALICILSSSVFVAKVLLSLTDRTSFALPGYEGISFRAAFSLSLNVELGENRDFKWPEISEVWSSSSFDSLSWSELSEWTGLMEGMIEATDKQDVWRALDMGSQRRKIFWMCLCRYTKWRGCIQYDGMQSYRISIAVTYWYIQWNKSHSIHLQCPLPLKPLCGICC